MAETQPAPSPLMRKAGGPPASAAIAAQLRAVPVLVPRSRRSSGSSPKGRATVVDLGAGTGALSRLLVHRVDEVVARWSPTTRMRSVLTESVAGVRVVEGRGEAMPLPDAGADAGA